jgi:lysophospholipase L1-like esterase
MPSLGQIAPVRLLPILLSVVLYGNAAVQARTIPAAAPMSRMSTQWWRARHEAKLAELRHGPIDLVFLGDSITQNWDKSGPPAWQDFAAVWRKFYGDRRALNLGFKGDATSHLLWRLQNGEVAGIAPKVAVILIGANNLGRLHWGAADDIAGIEAVVKEVQRRLPRTRVLLLPILPSERSAWTSETTAEVNHALAARFGSGAVPGVMFVDVAPLFQRAGVIDRTQFYDPLLTPPEPPLHPTAQAQARLAIAIEPLLAAMLGDHEHAM